MDTWDDYKLILTLARERTLRATAEAMGVNHSTISRRLAILGQRFGTPIFERTPDGYRPTDIGQDLVADAEQMDVIAMRGKRLSRTALSSVTGKVTVSIPNTVGQFLLLSELEAFSEQLPDIKLALHSSYELVDLDKAEADIVIRGTHNPAEHLVGQRLFPYALSYYCRKGYLEATPPSERRWIVDPSFEGPPEWLERTPFPKAPVGLRVQDIILRHQAVLAGHGMARGACYMADAEPDLMRLPGAGIEQGLPLWVLTHPSLRNIPRIQATMRFLSNTLRKKKSLITGALSTPAGE